MRIKNYYLELDKALKEWEEYKPYKQHNTEWICNRIDWCWHWKKITEQQKDELANRVIAVLDDQLETICRKSGYYVNIHS